LIGDKYKGEYEKTKTMQENMTMRQYGNMQNSHLPWAFPYAEYHDADKYAQHAKQ
jgi:hypothetical protein